jgi:hypothetical protein
MDDRLRLLMYLYDEEVDEASLARRLAEDESLRREYRHLCEVKEQLDARPASRPDPAVVDRVVETARAAGEAPKGPPSTPRASRPARSPQRSWTSRLQTAGAALAVVLLVGLGWWQGRSEADAPEASTGRSAVEPRAAVSEGAAPSTAVPAWDDRDQLVRIHRRIERLRSHSRPDRWGSALQPVQRP